MRLFLFFVIKKGPAIFCSVSDWTHVGTFITAPNIDHNGLGVPVLSVIAFTIVEILTKLGL